MENITTSVSTLLKSHSVTNTDADLQGFVSETEVLVFSPGELINPFWVINNSKEVTRFQRWMRVEFWLDNF
jgi:hypothetical protein